MARKNEPSDITGLPEKYQRLKLVEIAERIREHLKRFEDDPEINTEIRLGARTFFSAGAWRSGNRAFVQYVAYQNPVSLTKSQAIRYLASLDNGFVGQHWRLEHKI